MIRKTSLLHKIDPTALRSSFADVLHRWREYPRTTFAGDNTRSHEMRGDSAPLHGLTKAARGARIDLLFTMSDITRASQKPRRVDLCSCERNKSRASSGGAVWWSQTGSNRRPPACKAGALPTELWPLASEVFASGLLAAEPQPANRITRLRFAPARQLSHRRRAKFLPARRAARIAAFADGTAHTQPSTWPRRLVGLGRFELPTSRLSSARSNQLSYKPEPGAQ